MSTYAAILVRVCLFLKDIIYLFLDRGGGREKEGENHQCVAAPHASLTRDLAHNPGMCPDWESNQQPFSSQASAQSTEPHQPGQACLFEANQRKLPQPRTERTHPQGNVSEQLSSI